MTAAIVVGTTVAGVLAVVMIAGLVAVIVIAIAEAEDERQHL